MTAAADTALVEEPDRLEGFAAPREVEKPIGHDAALAELEDAFRSGRMHHAWLIAGPEGVGKRSFALKLAQALLCERVPEAELDPRETCPACVQVLAGTHPDLELVARPEGRSGLLVEQFIGTLEKRGQEGMCHNLARRPMMGTRRVAVIDDADTLDGEAANCLLKLLEEPPPRSVLILIGTSAEPDVGLSSPARQFKSVVLPEPDRPFNATNAPDSTLRLTPRNAGTSAPVFD